MKYIINARVIAKVIIRQHTYHQTYYFTFFVNNFPRLLSVIHFHFKSKMNESGDINVENI